MSDKITFVVYAMIGLSGNEEEIEVDKAEYEAVEDKLAYEQELINLCLPNIIESGIYIKE